MLPKSAADRIWQNVGNPALLRVFGVPAVHTNSDDDETSVTVILRSEFVAVGEFGERMEQRMTIQCETSVGAAIGDTFSITPDPTDDAPIPNPMIYRIAQLISESGLFRTFAVQQESL